MQLSQSVNSSTDRVTNSFFFWWKSWTVLNASLSTFYTVSQRFTFAFSRPFSSKLPLIPNAAVFWVTWPNSRFLIARTSELRCYPVNYYVSITPCHLRRPPQTFLILLWLFTFFLPWVSCLAVYVPNVCLFFPSWWDACVITALSLKETQNLVTDKIIYALISSYFQVRWKQC